MTRNRLGFICGRIGGLVCAAFLLLLANGLAASRPNIVFILSDDQRADTIGAWGNPRIATPNLDRLARRGASFTRAYCMGSMQGAVCVPSRAMLMTGRSLFRATAGPRSGKIPSEYTTWPEHFRAAGYKTIGIGKWHNDKGSFARSFSEGGPVFFGGMGDQFKVPVQPYDPEGVFPREARRIAKGYSTEVFTDAAVEFLKRQSGAEPFVLYLAFTVPHDPRTSPEEAGGRYKAEEMALPENFMPEHPFDNGELKIRDEKLLPWPRTEEAVRREIARYYAMITHMDAQIGRMIGTLEERGLAENTILVFASDHGLALGSHGLLGKQNLYEHSMRTPLIMAGPGIPRGSRFDALCYLFDVYPTLCELAGLAIPETVEGRSLVSVMRGESESGRSEIFTAYKDVQRSIHGARYKLIQYPKIDREQLFDLTLDPVETDDLSGSKEHAAIMVRLREKLEKAQAEFEDALVKK